MKYTQGTIGRIFVLRLENGDTIPGTIETFAASQQIQSATVQFLGGINTGSMVVVGPEDGEASTIVPMKTNLQGVYESLGVGTIFINESGKPVLHMHHSFGRAQHAVTGCANAGLDVWLIGEVVITELLDVQAKREKNPDNGFTLLEI